MARCSPSTSSADSSPAGLSGWIPATESGLVGVDVPDAGHDRLVAQKGLYGRGPLRQTLGQQCWGEAAFQWLGPEPRQHLLLIPHQPHGPQLSRVNEAQLAAAVQQEDVTGVTRPWVTRRPYHQRARHAQVHYEHPVPPKSTSRYVARRRISSIRRPAICRRNWAADGTRTARGQLSSTPTTRRPTSPCETR